MTTSLALKLLVSIATVGVVSFYRGGRKRNEWVMLALLFGFTGFVVDLIVMSSVHIELYCVEQVVISFLIYIFAGQDFLERQRR